MKFWGLTLTLFLTMAVCDLQAQEELIKYGDFETWVTRTIKESAIIGGQTKTLVEVGPNMNYSPNAYTNQGGSPWATSNVYARVSGISKTNSSVYQDTHNGGKCVKLQTHVEGVKVLGLVNIYVLAAGSLYLGSMQEPITSSKDPMRYLDVGIPFTRRPKALKFDYKVSLSSSPKIRQTGFSRKKELPGKDYCDAICMLQKRWEDEDGNIHALRVGTMVRRFMASAPTWQEGKSFTIHYGDITSQPFYRSFMGLMTGEGAFHATNSKGKLVGIIEEGWADANETPTHIIVKFDSSCGGAYIGSPGNTLWIDNVKLVY